MDTDEILGLFDREQRRDVIFTDVRREATAEVVRIIGIVNPDVVIQYSDLQEDNADAVIQRELDYAASLGVKLGWKLYSHDRPADLAARLEAHGLAPDELEAVLVLDLRSAPPALFNSQPKPGSEFEIRQVTQPEQVEDVIAVQDEVWGKPHGWLRHFAQALRTDPGALRMYCAYLDGAPVSAAWIRFHQGSQFASLWGGSTIQRARGRGLYTALLAIRAQDAVARGFRFLTIDASPMSRPIVERHGFQLITYAQDYDQS